MTPSTLPTAIPSSFRGITKFLGGWRGTLIRILLLGLILRLFLAARPGNEFDVAVNQGWARSAVELGLARSYVEQVNGNMLPNYPPFSLMIFAATGWLQYALDPTFSDPALFRLVIKLPSMLADLGTALLLFLIITRLWGKRWGLLGAFAYTFHPAVLYDSAVWGQTDTIYTFFIVAALAASMHRSMMLVGFLLALAVLSKMQTLAIAPLVLTLLLLGTKRQFLQVLLGAASAALLVFLPFAAGGTLREAFSVFTGSIGYYNIVSSAAYNLWWALLGDEAGRMQDTDLLFGLVTYRTAGLLIFALVAFIAMILLARTLKQGRKPVPKPDTRTIALFLGAALLASAFFLFNTEMHERYMFPVVALGLPVAFWSRKAAWLYIATTGLYFMNLLGWLPMVLFDRALYETFHSLDIAIATAQVIVFGGMFSLIFDVRKKAAEASATA